MQELALIDRLESATALLHPLRIELLRRMAEPRTCTELGKAVGATPQKVHYHVKVLEDHGLVRKVQERRVRGVVEGIYQASAHSYWLAPELVGRIGGEREAADRMSLGFLLDLTDRMRADLGALVRTARAGEHLPTLGLSARVELPDPSHREAFLEDLQAAVRDLARKHGARGRASGDGRGDRFELAVACYPSRDDDDPDEDGPVV